MTSLKLIPTIMETTLLPVLQMDHWSYGRMTDYAGIQQNTSVKPNGWFVEYTFSDEYAFKWTADTLYTVTPEN